MAVCWRTLRLVFEFAAAAVGDVARVDDQADDGKIRRRARGDAFQQPPGAVAVAEARLGAHVPRAGLDDARELRAQRVAVVRMDEVARRCCRRSSRRA